MSDFEEDLARDLPRGVPNQPGQLVDATWLDPQSLLGSTTWKYRDGAMRCAGLMLGYRNGHPIGYLDDRHALTIAGSRAGKGVSLIVPNLLLYDGSIVAIDPKGELARITARRGAKRARTSSFSIPSAPTAAIPRRASTRSMSSIPHRRPSPMMRVSLRMR